MTEKPTKSTRSATKRKKAPPPVKWSNERMRKFVSELAAGKSVQEAGATAGYAPNYVKTRIYTMMRTSDSFRQLVEQYAQHSVELIRNLYRVNLLPRAMVIDEKMLTEFEKNPKLAMRYPKPLDRIHKVAGTVADEAPSGVFPQINIQELQMMVQTRLEERERQLEAEVIDAEARKVDDG